MDLLITNKIDMKAQQNKEIKKEHLLCKFSEYKLFKTNTGVWFLGKGIYICNYVLRYHK